MKKYNEKCYKKIYDIVKIQRINENNDEKNNKASNRQIKNNINLKKSNFFAPVIICFLIILISLNLSFSLSLNSVFKYFDFKNNIRNNFNKQMCILSSLSCLNLLESINLENNKEKYSKIIYKIYPLIIDDANNIIKNKNIKTSTILKTKVKTSHYKSPNTIKNAESLTFNKLNFKNFNPFFCTPLIQKITVKNIKNNRYKQENKDKTDKNLDYKTSIKLKSLYKLILKHLNSYNLNIKQIIFLNHIITNISNTKLDLKINLYSKKICKFLKIILNFYTEENINILKVLNKIDEKLYSLLNTKNTENFENINTENFKKFKSKKWAIYFEKTDEVYDIREGISDYVLNNGCGHFEETKKENGNVSLAGHNRGYKINSFRHLKNLKKGLNIYYKYNDNIYKYRVFEKRIISDEDFSYIERKGDFLTLITCVENVPNKRLCLTALKY